MHYRALLAMVSIALLCQGCLVPSIHPLYTEADILPVPGIEGQWLEEDETNLWAFTALDDNTYRLAYIEGGSDTSEFSAIFLLLDERVLFMDMYPEGPDDLADAYKMHLMAVHSFWRVDLNGDSLTMSVLDADWVNHLIDSAGISVTYEELDNNEVLLTASTEELQIWLSEIVDRPEAFSPVQLCRPK